MTRPVRIANCSGFYGDRLSAAREMVEGGPIDVLSGDWLAELTMGILVRDRMKDPSGGYARTILKQLKDVLAPCLDRNIRIVTNAGGTNPRGLADAVASLAASLDLPRAPRIAVVTGDEITPTLSDWIDEGVLRGLDGGPWTPGPGMPMAAHAYLGAAAVASALAEGADLVITGRCTDAALVVGPAMWWHGWTPDAWDALAGALVAGHIIECGAQATGGNYSGWQQVPGLEHVGYPIAEIAGDGSAIITKHPGTGGAVTRGTVTAQLLYEVGGPRYLSPDVVARLDTVHLDDLGDDRVRVHGTRGEPAPDTLKAGVLLLAGQRNEVVFLVGGGDVEAKAAFLDRQFWGRLGGKGAFAEARTDVWRGDHPDAAPWQRLSRVVCSAADPDPDKVGRRFGAVAVELALASVPGLTLERPPEASRPIAVFEPALVPRARVPVTVTLGERVWTVPHPPSGAAPDIAPSPGPAPTVAPTGTTRTVALGAIAAARSGDKAGTANIGFFALHPSAWPAVRDAITPDAVRAWLGGWSGPVEIHPLPNLAAVNVLVPGWLGRGVAANLAPDPQAKGLAEALRTAHVAVDTAYLP